jgi:hypothetical protein
LIHDLERQSILGRELATGVLASELDVLRMVVSALPAITEDAGRAVIIARPHIHAAPRAGKHNEWIVGAFVRESPESFERIGVGVRRDPASKPKADRNGDGAEPGGFGAAVIRLNK